MESKIQTAEEAAAQGASDGIEDVYNTLNEDGIEAVVDTLKPGRDAWDTGARNGGVAEFAGVPEEFEDAYYAAYASAARECAEKLAAEHNARSVTP